MQISKIRALYHQCDNCNKRFDGKLITNILFFKKSLILCDDCLKGLNLIIDKMNRDNKEHYYCSENKESY